MSSAKRRLNYTGRKRIKQEHIDIRMVESPPGEPLKARVSLDIGDHGFPSDANVIIEAYHRSSGMRFECGTVGALNIPPILVLNEVDRSGSVLFRVKVADGTKEKGRLLGAAERVQPRSEDESDGRRSFFPIIYRNLGAEVWKVEIEYGNRPTLILNTLIPSFSHKLKEDPVVQGLLLPAALRIVLENLVAQTEPGDDDEDTGGWQEDWIRYCESELKMSGDISRLDSEERKEWVEEAVQKFSQNGDFVTRIRKL